MANEYLLGSVILLTDTITNPSTGTLTDDATEALTVYEPDGVSQAIGLAHSGTGVYSAQYTATKVGWHEYVFSSTGTAAGAARGRFYVQAVP
jgi:hypothetical protein